LTNEYYDSLTNHACENRYLKIPDFAAMTSVLNISSLAEDLEQNTF